MKLWLARLDRFSNDDLTRVTALVLEHGEVVRHVQLATEHLIVFRSNSAPDAILRCVAGLPGVEALTAIETPYVLSGRQAARARTRVRLSNGAVIGGGEFVVMAGPCAVETRAQTLTTAQAVRAAGARVLRGGAFKPRTSPFSFQGLGRPGLELLQSIGKSSGLPTISEVMDARQLDDVIRYIDIVQVGMRNALNYTLLSEIGAHPSRPPVLLKRGIGSSLSELLCAADYVLAAGNPHVVLCLRGTLGSRDQPSRATLNVGDIPALRARTHLPILVDPSHAAGERGLVPAISAAALAAGADGLLIEVHHDPDRALVDGRQSLTLPQFGRLMNRLRALSRAVGRSMAAATGPTSSASDHPYEDLGLERPPYDIRHDSHETDILGNAQV